MFTKSHILLGQQNTMRQFTRSLCAPIDISHRISSAVAVVNDDLNVLLFTVGEVLALDLDLLMQVPPDMSQSSSACETWALIFRSRRELMKVADTLVYECHLQALQRLTNTSADTDDTHNFELFRHVAKNVCDYWKLCPCDNE